MILVARDEHEVMLGVCLGDKAVDLLDEGTGGVLIGDPGGVERVDDGLGHAVAADDEDLVGTLRREFL